MKITSTINKKNYDLDVNPNLRLLDILRDVIGLTGTKESCGEGECGACTVIMNGKTVNSCLVLASQIDGQEIITIEGLKENGEYDLLQTKFVENGAVQCGFCTPGMILSSKVLLMKNPNPSEGEIRRALEGNLCRCTGYVKIIAAVKAAAKSE